MEGYKAKCMWICLFLIVGITNLLAGPRDFLQAQKIAQQKAAALGASINQENILQARAKGQGKATPQNTTPYYIFNFADHAGYVIVGGDDRMPAIVGYSDQGTLNMDSLPENFKSLLDAYKVTVEAVERGDSVAIKNVQAAMKREAGAFTPVKPLLGNIAWGQGAPYNKYCPMDHNGARTVTGCVATAMAQIMRYWKYPSSLLHDIPAYTSSSMNLYVVDVDSIPQGIGYDWENMLESYPLTQSYTETQTSAVATLMQHVGASVKMTYGNSSSAAMSDALFALPQYFGYDKNTIKEINHTTSDWESWNQILQAELQAKRPILYSGSSAAGTGHAFVCDGINSDGYYHINWGWNGESNNYFDITILRPSGMSGYNLQNDIIIGIMPNRSLDQAPSFKQFVAQSNNYQITKSQRKDEADTFAGTVSYTLRNIGEKHEALCSLGLVDDEGRITRISTDESMLNLSLFGEGQVQFHFNYAFGNGVHKICAIESRDNGKTWEACYRSTIEIFVKNNNILEERYASIKSNSFRFRIDKFNNTASLLANDYFGAIEVPEMIQYEDERYTVTSIEENCFSQASITSITLPQTITTIKRGSFYNCINLGSIVIPKSVVDLGSDATYQSYGCFEKCINLTQVTFEEGSQLKIIGDRCFRQCGQLKDIKIPQSVEEIQDWAFEGNDGVGLDSVYIPSDSKLRRIGNAFAGSNLKSIYIPSLVEEIAPLGDQTYGALGEGCFAYCKNLKTVTFAKDSQLKIIGSNCFKSCSQLKSIELPNSVTSLGNSCFFVCSSLTSIHIPSELRRIGDFCFYSCSNWTGDIEIPEGMTELPQHSFGHSSSLTSLSLPSSLQELGSYSIIGSQKMKSLSIKALNVPENFAKGINEGAWDKQTFTKDFLTLYVPASSVDAYKQAVGEYFKAVLPLAETGISTPNTNGILVFINHGNIHLSGIKEGITVKFYAVDGRYIGESPAVQGSASFHCNESIVIAKVGRESIKIAMR